MTAASSHILILSCFLSDMLPEHESSPVCEWNIAETCWLLIADTCDEWCEELAWRTMCTTPLLSSTSSPGVSERRWDTVVTQEKTHTKHTCSCLLTYFGNNCRWTNVNDTVLALRVWWIKTQTLRSTMYFTFWWNVMFLTATTLNNHVHRR